MNDQTDWKIVLGLAVIGLGQITTQTQLIRADLALIDAQAKVTEARSQDSPALQIVNEVTDFCNTLQASDRAEQLAVRKDEAWVNPSVEYQDLSKQIEKAERDKKDLERQENQQEGAKEVLDSLNEPELRKAEQMRDNATLEAKAVEDSFENQKRDLTGKLDKMAEKFFDKNPGLNDAEIGDAKNTFAEVKKDAVAKLENQKNEKLAEIEARQSEQRAKSAELLKQLDQTRTQR